ncbi:hypothetical protein DM02DRAFT_664783 [Periconia macrospinosa]|uniref:Uncharacterized protein n=1 Tax=Periconia macrospinosa TaxID=97972 RepID=A0A2V1CY79_9PLEO|nr:hypothetical protein DM02DRAFT_664783 [Periconia macrospinosa]
MKYLPFLVAMTAGQSLLPFDQILPILWSPVVSVQAGQEIAYQLSNARNVSCEATIHFQNSTFLPITMRVRPKPCAGDQNAFFTLPVAVPDGMMAVEWECSGSNATLVDIMAVSGGTGDSEALLQEETCMVVECRNTSSSGMLVC